MEKKETPDMKSRRVSGQGIKGKLGKKKLVSGGKKKKNAKGKPRFSSDSRVYCDWCEESFSRWVILLSRSWVYIIYVVGSAIWFRIFFVIMGSM